MYDTGLADRIRAKGVPVVEVAGWQVRGNPTGFAPRGALNHHTAGASVAAVPSLATVIYGRPGLPGPLAQVLQSRELNPADDKAYVVAAGKANHAGVGYWLGLNSNYQLEGLEVEHVGTTTVDPARLETAARIIAAMLEAPGSTADAAYAAQHAEYARPLGRKIDFANLAPWTPDTFRARVAYWVGRTVNDDTPMQEDDMPVRVIYVPGDPEGRDAFMAVGPGYAVQFRGDTPDAHKLAVERYEIGRKLGMLGAPEPVKRREYDVAADLARRLAPR